MRFTNFAKSQTQLDNLEAAAKELETDDDPERFERMRKIAKQKPEKAD